MTSVLTSLYRTTDYSPAGVTEDITTITNYFELYSELTKNDHLALHLDVCLPNFVAENKIETYIAPVDYFRGIEEGLTYYRNNFETRIELNIHFMGLSDDYEMAEDFIANYTFGSDVDWVYYIENSSHFSDERVGSWYDDYQWGPGIKLKEKNVLLMSVKAGNSGQRKTKKTEQKMLKVAAENPTTNFVFDGGWGVDFETELKNVKVVSYGSFWKEFKSKV